MGGSREDEYYQRNREKIDECLKILISGNPLPSMSNLDAVVLGLYCDLGAGLTAYGCMGDKSLEPLGYFMGAVGVVSAVAAIASV